jgi:hypothetical protein
MKPLYSDSHRPHSLPLSDPALAAETEWRGIDGKLPAGTTWRGGVDATEKPHGNGRLVWPVDDPREFSAGTMMAGRMHGQWLLKYRMVSKWRALDMSDDISQQQSEVMPSDGFPLSSARTCGAGHRPPHVKSREVPRLRSHHFDPLIDHSVCAGATDDR